MAFQTDYCNRCGQEFLKSELQKLDGFKLCEDCFAYKKKHGEIATRKADAKFSRNVECEGCRGDGYIRASGSGSTEKCRECNGTGRRHVKGSEVTGNTRLFLPDDYQYKD